jgi:hypothetical protein
MWPHVCNCFRHCFTIRLSNCTIALRSTQLLTEMSTRNFLAAKRGRCIRPKTTPLPLSWFSWKCGSLKAS